IVNRSYAELLRGHPDLNEVLAFDRGASRHGIWAAARSYANFFRLLHEQAFDLVLDLQGLLRSGLMALATGATRRVGLSTAREGARFCYTEVVPVADFDAIHAVDRYWLMAEAIGMGEAPKVFHIPIGEAERCWALERMRDCPRPWLAFGVGSRWIT